MIVDSELGQLVHIYDERVEFQTLSLQLTTGLNIGVLNLGEGGQIDNFFSDTMMR